MKKVKNNQAQFLVTPEQYKFLMNYYKEMAIYPNRLIADKTYWDNGFELVFKGLGISSERKDGFEIIDLRDLGNDLNKWIHKFYKNSYGDDLVSVEDNK